MADDEVQYELKAVHAVRGTEARSIAKWQNDGWEYVDQTKGKLSTTLNFRRPKPKTFNDYVLDSVAAFRRLQPKTRLALAGSTGLILVVGILGVAVAQGGGDSDKPSPVSVSQSVEPSEASSVDEPVDEPVDESYVYQGPEYEVIAIDEDAGMGQLDQYWVYTDELDYSTDAYQDQVKLLITDVATQAGTTEIIVQVVTDKEIIEAESAATIANFMASHDSDYWTEVMVPKEAKGWVASYTGGIDSDAGELSDSDSAFEITWWIAGDNPEIEQWMPTIAG